MLVVVGGWSFEWVANWNSPMDVGKGNGEMPVRCRRGGEKGVAQDGRTGGIRFPAGVPGFRLAAPGRP